MGDSTIWMFVAGALFLAAIFTTMSSGFSGTLTPIEIVATCAVDGKLYFERDDVTVTCEVVRK